MKQLQGAKPFNIDRWDLYHAYVHVKSNRGSAGIDGIELSEYEKELKGNLYRLWNRMSSGSYMPKAVKLVEIPKPDGGSRPLGIPTVEDRIAQMLVVRLIEPSIDKIFHEDSYGYRPNRSAHQAIGIARERCWRCDWVLDMDISKFFDTIDHGLLMRAVERHVEEKWILLYIRRWLVVPYEKPDGSLEERTCGVPQGSVIGPILANLYLHYCFDKWMEINHPSIKFERYADDTICHCRSRQEAEALLDELSKRFDSCKLSLNVKKTKIVYCKDERRRQEYFCISFDFLGHTFRPRKTMNRVQRKAFTRFLPDISQKAKKYIKDTMRSWKLKSKSHTPLDLIASEVNPILRGWMNYYGKFCMYSIKRIMEDFNFMLARWAKAKYKRFKKKPMYLAFKWLGGIAKRALLFYHWKLGVYPKNVTCY
ncbi:group II intron reverse transcriptase/maturase [Bacteroides sp. 224]|uniref:group II intron reverse transcriptase/maturase n=1 Tax=Bacteroides sp. 224 TaxID=2302936 RepID=UPI0013D17433|nr:group II intron reverse transcriptase/maturase [Bacteroides sp. 224]NDV66510.1 group II intron reverse transcriptase/maturase [Bacteroides sp. 224]